MKMKKQLERLQEWACNKTKKDCYYCEYSIYDDVDGSVCPFWEVIRAAEDRAKEKNNGLKN